MATNQLIDRLKAGALIPTQHSNEIIKGLTAPSAALKLMRKVTMSSKDYKMPVLTALPEAYWVSEGGLKQTTQVEWGSKTLVAEELAVVIPIHENVLEDSTYDIWGEIRPLLIEAFGARIDAAVLFGNGKPGTWTDPSIMEGIADAENAIALGSITDPANADFAEYVNQAMAFVEEDGYDVTGFAGRRSLRTRLRGLRNVNGDPLFTMSVREDNTAEPTIYGEPLTFVTNGTWDDSAATLIAGDWSKAIIGLRKDITMKLFTEGVVSDETGKVVVNLMQNDSVALRAVMRVAYAVATPINRENASNADRFPFAAITPEAVTP